MRRLFSPAALFKQALMLSMAVAAIYPVYYMIETSLKTRKVWTQDQFGLPIPPTLENYADAPPGRADPDLVHEQRHRHDGLGHRGDDRVHAGRLSPSRVSRSAAGRSCCGCSSR